MHDFIHRIPKVELHVHLEGTLEPELMFKFAQRNDIKLRYPSEVEIKRAFDFQNLDSFLNIYFEAVRVLIKEEDFYELTLGYLQKIFEQNVRHVEVFFDPQAHTERGVSFYTIITGISRALQDSERLYGITSKLMMCFYRHLSEKAAFETLEVALPYKKFIYAVGLDAAEDENPPSKFQRVFNKARAEGFATVAHAWEGPVEYMWQALDLLKVSRIDHGIRCFEDDLLVERLVREKMPLTVCPISNLKLKAYEKLADHPIKAMMDRGIVVTLNSDDPAFFATYIEDVYLAVQETFNLDIDDIYHLARNSIESSFMPIGRKHNLLRELDLMYMQKKLEKHVIQLQSKIEELEILAKQLVNQNTQLMQTISGSVGTTKRDRVKTSEHNYSVDQLTTLFKKSKSF